MDHRLVARSPDPRHTPAEPDQVPPGDLIVVPHSCHSAQDGRAGTTRALTDASHSWFCLPPTVSPHLLLSIVPDGAVVERDG